MKTRRERRIDQWRVFGAFVFAFLAFIAMLTGCATVPVSPEARIVQEAERCIQMGGCFTLSVDNASGVERATVFLNGRMIGDVEGGDSHDFTVFERQLIHGRCATVTVRLHPSRAILRSVDTDAKEECLGGRSNSFTADITNSQKALWLTPWPKR